MSPIHGMPRLHTTNLIRLNRVGWQQHHVACRLIDGPGPLLVALRAGGIGHVLRPDVPATAAIGAWWCCIMHTAEPQSASLHANREPIARSRERWALADGGGAVYLCALALDVRVPEFNRQLSDGWGGWPCRMLWSAGPLPTGAGGGSCRRHVMMVPETVSGCWLSSSND